MKESNQKGPVTGPLICMERSVYSSDRNLSRGQEAVLPVHADHEGENVCTGAHEKVVPGIDVLLVLVEKLGARADIFESFDALPEREVRRFA